MGTYNAHTKACKRAQRNAPVPRYAGTSTTCQIANACHMTGVTTIHIMAYIQRPGNNSSMFCWVRKPPYAGYARGPNARTPILWHISPKISAVLYVTTLAPRAGPQQLAVRVAPGGAQSSLSSDNSHGGHGGKAGKAVANICKRLSYPLFTRLTEGDRVQNGGDTADHNHP